MPEVVKTDWEDVEVTGERQGPEAAKGKIKQIELSLIVPPAQDVRSWIPAEHIESLAASLAAVGLIHEPVVFQSGDRYEIISGQCRYLAAKRLGWLTIRCKIIDAEAAQADIMKLHENMFRADLSALEKAEFIAGLKSRYELTDDDIARRLGKSRAWVTRILVCLRYPEDVQAALRDGVIPFEVAYELSRVTDDTHRAQLLEYAVKDGASRRIAKLWREDWERTTRAMEQIHAHEAQAKLEERRPELLDRARLAQIADRAEFREAHRIPECACDMCGEEVREDSLIAFRLCQDCTPAIVRARQSLVAQAQGV